MNDIVLFRCVACSYMAQAWAGDVNSTAFCPQCGLPVERADCRSCGRPLTVGPSRYSMFGGMAIAPFCGACGEPTATPREPQMRERKQAAKEQESNSLEESKRAFIRLSFDGCDCDDCKARRDNW